MRTSVVISDINFIRQGRVRVVRKFWSRARARRFYSDESDRLNRLLDKGLIVVGRVSFAAPDGLRTEREAGYPD